MTSRERVSAALRGQALDRIPRSYEALPGFHATHPGAWAQLEARFPQDVAGCGWRPPAGATHGDPHAVGEYVDEWDCTFENLHPGVIGQVKHPLIDSYDRLATFRPPWHLLDGGREDVSRTCAASNAFIFSPLPVQPFERLQFLRGTEQLFEDLAEQPSGFFELREMVHAFNVRWVETWCATPVDAIMIADDWGTQRSLLISPAMWRSLFKPLYADYIRLARQAGKFTYMHTDGYTLDIIEDLIELGLDAINAQVTCMDMAELGRRFRGRITFWGQMDRQHMLCFGSTDEARRHVHDFHTHLAAPPGSRIVAQMYLEPSARPENAVAVLEEFERIHRAAPQRG